MIEHIRFDIELAAEMKINKKKQNQRKKKQQLSAQRLEIRFDLIIMELDIEGTFKASA